MVLATPALAAPNQQSIYGLNEHVFIMDPELAVSAKLDTGAQTASLSAKDIQRFRRNGESWVRFVIAADGASEETIERPLARISKIKRRAGDYDPEQDGKTYTARPVIEIELCMGDKQHTIEVNLTDRSTFEFPLLIGSDALSQFNALIDPSRTYIAGKPSCSLTNANAAE